MPVTATTKDATPAPSSSTPLVLATLLAPVRHGQSAAGPDPTNARGKARSNSNTPPVAASPIKPIQTMSMPRTVTPLRIA
jgi:hypothetical protein